MRLTTTELQITVPADTGSLAELRTRVHETAALLGAPAELADEFVLVVSELATNVVMHTDDESVSVGVDVDERSWIIEVTGADALVVPTGAEAPDPSDIGGRGLFLVSALMDAVDVVDAGTGRAVRCLKHRISP